VLRCMTVSRTVSLASLQTLVVSTMLLEAAVESSVLAALPFLFFLVAIGVQYPRPGWRLWNVCLFYVAMVRVCLCVCAYLCCVRCRRRVTGAVLQVLAAKFLFQLRLFCQHWDNEDAVWTYALWFQHRCSSDPALHSHVKIASKVRAAGVRH
jgi:hypothetical protein